MMNLSNWPSAFPNRVTFGGKYSDNSVLVLNNPGLGLGNYWHNSLSSANDGYGSSASDITDNYATSCSGSEVTSKKASEPSTWSLVSAASTSTSSFYPACASLSASKLYRQDNLMNRGQQQQQQQEISINLGRENDDDSETEKAQSHKNSSVIHQNTTKSSSASAELVQNESMLAESGNSLSEENCMLVNDSIENDEKCVELKQLMERISELETKNKEQIAIIAKLREENVQQRISLTEGNRERENLLIRNASLCHQLEYEKREWSIEREQLAMQLDDVTRELELQKMLLNSESISEIVQRWENKVFDLKGMVYDRDRAIRAQQQRISELMNRYDSNDSDSTTLSKYNSIKRAVLQLLTGKNHKNRDNALKSISNTLKLTDDEETAIRNSLENH